MRREMSRLNGPRCNHLNARLVVILIVIFMKSLSFSDGMDSTQSTAEFVTNNDPGVPTTSNDILTHTSTITPSATTDTTPTDNTTTSTARSSTSTTSDVDIRSISSTAVAGVNITSIVGSTSTATTIPADEYDFLNNVQMNFENLNINLQNRLRIEAIKRDILNRLGMTRIPDVSHINTTVAERRQILRLYKKSFEELHGRIYSSLLFDDDQFYANRFHSFTEYGERPPSVSDRLWRNQGGKRIYFSIDIPEPNDPRKETVVKSATLKLFKREVRPQNLLPSDMIDRSIRIEIYQIVQLSADHETPGEIRHLRRSIDSRLVSLDKSSWEEFDVSRAVQDWIRDPSSNFGLEITCDNRYRMEQLLEFTFWSPAVADKAYHHHHHRLQSNQLPALNVLTQEKRILGRQKRTASASLEQNDCLQGDGEERCCRFPLTINFTDIGWGDWVIAPLSYQAYYCEGSCPRNYKVAHRYARIKSIMRDLNPSTPLSVNCLATRMGHLHIAHFNSNNEQVVSVFENMFPEQCMCA